MDVCTAALAAPRPDGSRVHAVAIAFDGQHHSICHGAKHVTCSEDLKSKSETDADLTYNQIKSQAGGGTGVRKRMAVGLAEFLRKNPLPFPLPQLGSCLLRNWADIEVVPDDFHDQECDEPEGCTNDVIKMQPKLFDGALKHLSQTRSSHFQSPPNHQ